MGIGHHGEPGIEVCELETADKMAARMTDIVFRTILLRAEMRWWFWCPALGQRRSWSCTCCIMRSRRSWVRGDEDPQGLCGELFILPGYDGGNLTVMKLDDELKELIDLDCCSMGLKQL